MLVMISGFIFLLLSLIVVLFQFALALGVPWGSFAMGGKYPGRFPLSMRIAAVCQALFLTILGLIVLSKSDFAFHQWKHISNTAIWFVVGIYVISSIMNLITPSKVERVIWAPVAILMVITSSIVALG